MPQVSVVITVLDPEPRYLLEAVRSILDQTLHDIELILVEDPSPRSGKAMLSQVQDDRLRHILNPRRTSLIEQKNQGLQEARGEYVALLGGDDISEPDRLDKQLAFLKAHPEIDVLGAQTRIIDSVGKSLGFRAYPCHHSQIVRAMQRFNAIADPSVMFRRAVILKAGGYQYAEQPAEDYELWCRLVCAGHVTFANHPEVLVRYRIHPQAGKSTRLRGTLQATLEIKERYFGKQMDFLARLRMWGERFLLWLPPPLVMRLFLAFQYRAQLPSRPRLPQRAASAHLSVF
jgi:glycosyltransferase involved in cell wall biosynthesis